MSEIEKLAQSIIHSLKTQNKTIATAESCTGGKVAAVLTDVPGSSLSFAYGFVTYSDEAKQKVLQVPADLLSDYTAVSNQVAIAMVTCALGVSGSDFAVSVTGVAGPSQPDNDHPVGLVYIAVGSAERITCQRFLLTGDRHAIRSESVLEALKMIEEFINQEPIQQG